MKTFLYKPDMLPYEIWDIRYNKNGYPSFLIYRKGQWRLISAKHFTPEFVEDGLGGYLSVSQ